MSLRILFGTPLRFVSGTIGSFSVTALGDNLFSSSTLFGASSCPSAYVDVVTFFSSLCFFYVYGGSILSVRCGVVECFTLFPFSFFVALWAVMCSLSL